MSGWKLAAAVGVVGLLIGVPWYFKMIADPAPGVVPQPSTTPPTTRLIIEMSGGFAYVPDDVTKTFEVGYLNHVNLTGDAGQVLCQVHEIGTELILVRGTLSTTSPGAKPKNRTFDLNGVNVTIPALASLGKPVFTRASYPPGPNKPANKAEWKNLQYVPSLKELHQGSRLNTKWRDIVSGRLELRGGSVEATYPSDPAIELADFKFQRPTATPPLDKDIAVTDKITFTVDVPGTGVDLVFTKSTIGSGPTFPPLKYTNVRIEPTAPGQAIRLKLHGLHSSDSLSSFVEHDEVKDFCAFYSLLDLSSPLHTKADMVKMTYNGPTGAFDPKKKPSPGYFCMGDWF